MKKAISYLMAFTMLFLLVIPVSAKEKEVVQKEKVIYQAKEITNQKELYERAVKGIKDVPINDLSLPKQEMKNNQTKENVELSEHVTSQLLNVKTVDDTEIQEIAVTTFVTPESSTILEPTFTTFATSGSKSEEEWDSSYGVRAYSTIYYSRTTKDGVSYAKVTKASGGWSISDSSISLSSRKVTIGTSGWPAGTQSITKYPTGNSWSYSTPTSWEYISTTSGHSIGATSTVTLKRGSSTWTLKLNNNL
ncbi:hypothetical protein FZC66_06830 [Priestia megaterium]|nr:hypothetical protein FZC66_06830 [Priestia megaterium]